MFEEMKVKHAAFCFEDPYGNTFEAELDESAAEGVRRDEGRITLPSRNFRFYAPKARGGRTIEFLGKDGEFYAYVLSLTDSSGGHVFPCIFPREILEAFPDYRERLQEFYEGAYEETFDLRYSVVKVNGTQCCWVHGFVGWE